MLRRIRGWLRRRRRRRAANKQQEPLREFVYLDEVSVYSLIASRLGPIAVEFTDTETSSLQSELSSTIGANVGVAKSDLSSRLQAMRSQESQVLRKSIVQTTFRELYKYEKGRLLVSPIELIDSPPEMPTSEQLEGWLANADPPWVVDAEGLARGELLELEVELDAEPIFRINTVVSTMLEITRESPELADMVGAEQLGQMQSVGRVLEKLLAGLIPIRARLTDYVAVEVGGVERLLHRTLLESIEPSAEFVTRSVSLVGIAEEALFWKDIRRVLFAGSRYRVLCRVARTGIQDSWTPVKLSDVFKEVAPEAASSFEFFNQASAAISAIDNTGRGNEQKKSSLNAAVVQYAQQLAAHFGHDVSSEELVEQPFMTMIGDAAVTDLKDRRRIFNEVTSYLEGRFGFTADRAVAAQFRTVALFDTGFTAYGEAALAGDNSLGTSSNDDQRFLDVELVAIYW